MGDISDNNNQQMVNYEPITLIDEISSTLVYIGVSINGGDITAPVWRIKKIAKNGTLWNISAFPDGDQAYKWKWNERATLTYI